MKTRLAVATGFALIGALLLYTLAVYGHLPDRLPIHWNIRGEADGWADKKTAVLLMPGTLVVLIAMMLGLPVISPRQFSIESFRSSFNYIMLVVMGLMGYIHIIMLQAGLHPDFNMNHALFGGIFLFFALIGNVMGKTKRNFWMGIRTPWTLASDRVWDATHRLTGRLMVACGVIGAILAFTPVPPMLLIVALVASMLYPAIYSYFLYRQLESDGKS